MRYGKLSDQDLKTYVLNNISKPKRSDIVLGASSGEDCAVLRLEDYIFITSDPITGSVDPEVSGALAVHVVCNDLAASGAQPVAVVLNILLPEYTTPEILGQMVRSAQRAADSVGAVIVGGHTEYTTAVTRPVVVAAAVGNGKRSIFTSGAKPGDDIIVTKNLGLEGTAIIAADCQGKLMSLDPKVLASASSLLDQISVVPEGLIASSLGASALHDITEGGVLGALDELTSCGGLGCKIFADKIPVLEITKVICDQLQIDPLRLLSSGSMIITSDQSDIIVQALTAKGIKATVIGQIMAKPINILVRDGIEHEFCAEPDHINKLV